MIYLMYEIYYYTINVSTYLGVGEGDRDEKIQLQNNKSTRR
jgi:hypothetical protein